MLQRVLLAAIAAIAGALGPASLSADEPRPLAPGAVAKESLQLVQSLGSRNAQPPPVKPHVRNNLPADFDENENRRVIAVRDALLAKGVDAFPALIDALDDSGYCYTKTSGSSYGYHFTVREVCFRILAVQINVHRLTRPILIEFRPNILGLDDSRSPEERMMKWWETRKDKTLHELQLESLQWSIQFERRRGFMDKEEESVVLEWNRPLLERLTKSKKPIRVNFDGGFVDEEHLTPKQDDLAYWFEKWGAKWHLKPEPDPPIVYKE